MIITSKFLGTEVQLSLGQRSAHWVVALVAGSVFLACSGTIETPTEEYPARSSAAAPDAEDDEDGPSQTASAPPRAPAAQSSNDDEDEPPTPAASDDDEPVAAEEPPADDDEAGGGATTTLAFEADIFPILSSTCTPCHVGAGAGGNAIADTDVARAFEEVQRVGDNVLARVEAGTMPPQCLGGDPGDSGCIAADDLATLQEWYAAGLPE